MKRNAGNREEWRVVKNKPWLLTKKKLKPSSFPNFHIDIPQTKRKECTGLKLIKAVVMKRIDVYIN